MLRVADTASLRVADTAYARGQNFNVGPEVREIPVRGSVTLIHRAAWLLPFCIDALSACEITLEQSLSLITVVAYAAPVLWYTFLP